MRLGPCTYCGFCEWFGCGNYSKASPQTTILPALLRKPNFSARDNSEVMRINVDGSGKRATGVTFVDTDGNEWEQPADLVILSAFTIFNVQLLLLSKIGKPYDPVSNSGVVGRNFTHQTISDVTSFFDPAKFIFNPFIASGAIGMCIDEFNGDNFDHGPHGFVGGGYMGQVQTNGRPIETTPVPPGTPLWGAEWKKAVKENYQSALKPGTGVHGSMYSYRDVYVDLDPTYKDRFGRPLARITMDFHDNEIKQNAFLTDKFAEIFQGDGRKASRQGISQGAIRHHASIRRRISAAAPSWALIPHQRIEPVSPELGRSESVRHGRKRVSAECRLQSDRHGCGAGVLGGGCDPYQISQKSRTTYQCVAWPPSLSRWRLLPQVRVRGERRPAGFCHGRAWPLSGGCRRLQELPYRSRQQSAVCRRPTD